MKHWTDEVLKRWPRACEPGIADGRRFDTLAEWWANCECGDYMLWLAGKCAGEPGSDLRRPLVLAACECARLTLPYLPKGKTQQSLECIEYTEAWARGKHNDLDGIREKAAAAYAAYAAYGGAAAAYAAYAISAATAAVATHAATYAATVNATARKETLAKCADIVRKHYPQPPTWEK